uniref:Uncharacterized protein n=1 Tax=viral metagenome TaxID=1070528 RepID=A0A6C0KQP8_9ZZZZ
MSNGGTINIDPSTITDIKTVTGFRVSINSLELFTSVSLRVELISQQGSLLDIRYLVLTGDDYTNWNNDDTYIINITAQKLGFVLAPTVVAPVVVPEVAPEVAPVVDPEAPSMLAPTS